jgi:hypothetical protein
MASQATKPTDRSSAAINETTATQVAGQNLGRQYLFIQNLSTKIMYVSITGAVAVQGAAGTILLAANGGFSEWEGNMWVPSSAISIIAATAGGTGNVVTVLEA